MSKPLVISLVFILQHLFSSAVVAAQSPTQKCIDGDKLCFGSPPQCPTSSEFNCDILVLISFKGNSSGLDVDVYGKGSPGTYFALGFVTEPNTMSGATVVHCDYNEDSTLAVNEGYTEGYSLRSLPVGTLTEDTLADIENGVVHCHWTQKPNGVAGESSLEYNIHREYYVQHAYGSISGGSLKHHKKRSITSTTVNLTSVGVISSSNKIPLAVRVHGSMMTIAWLCLVSIAMIIARYHKDSWGNTKLCNVNVWFALHRGLMVSALSSAIIGMITIFVHAKGWRANSPHQYLGLSANIFMILQPLGALFRPAPDHKNRIFFNILHTLGGNIGHALAILALFFVAKLSITLSKGYFILLIIFLAFYSAAHLTLQFHPHLLSKLNMIEATDMADLKSGTNNSSSQSSSHPVRETIERSKKRVLTLFISLVIVITISIIIFINLGSS
ncbi:putative ferric-chelate reductase 1 homolog [Panonychus citri]|uniref:putative ferric-chelate reductase 1 homolog n=1 Tax=Panonychus citri TaxID=50023 RepID=UPI002307FD62|nr:putative ferric-chelate reductase 1 homolog [Panonychus citri]XP_053209237.1 putative ferric-chelate reductase 1 homolog [Panonychus citri]